jgi:hypothetical protein
MMTLLAGLRNFNDLIELVPDAWIRAAEKRPAAEIT